MSYTNIQLNNIFDRTSGLCHLCRTQLNFRDYGNNKVDGGWEVDHSRPKAKGGTDHGNNLYAACADCNRSKGTRSTRSFRAEKGFTKAPLAASKRKEVQVGNTVGGTVFGFVVGLFLGPGAWFACGAIGAVIGNQIDPDSN